MLVHQQTNNGRRNIINGRKLAYWLKTFIIVLLLPMLLSTPDVVLAKNKPVSAQDVVFAAKKKSKSKKKKRRPRRVYNPTKTKQQAIGMLQTSDELSSLANIEKTNNINSVSQAYIKDSSSASITNNIIPDTIGMSDVELLRTFYSQEEASELAGDFGEDEAELAQEDDINVDISDFKTLWLMAMGGSDENQTTSYGANKEELMNIIMAWFGTPYRFGADSRKAIDCSAWTQAVFLELDSIMLPRTARSQIELGRNIPMERLEFGDLIFFHTYSRKFASHVGIYLGDNLFAHASSAVGVTVSSLESTYYNKRFITGKRFTETEFANQRKNIDRQ